MYLRTHYFVSLSSNLTNLEFKPIIVHNSVILRQIFVFLSLNLQKYIAITYKNIWKYF